MFDWKLDDEFSKMEKDLESQRIEMEEQEKRDDIAHEWPIYCRICYDKFGDVPLFPPIHSSPIRGQVLSGITVLNTLIQQQPDKPINYVNRGFHYLKLIDRENDALFDFQRAISFRAEGQFFLKSILGISIINVRGNKYNEALSVLESIVNIPTLDKMLDKMELTMYAYCLYLRGVLHERNRSYIKAIADFTPAIELGHIPMALRERGFCFMAIGDFEPASQDLDQVVEAVEWEHIIDKDAEKYARCYVWRAQIYARSGKYAEALRDINKAIDTEAVHKNPGWFLQRGKFYHAMGQYEWAVLDFSHVIDGKMPQDHKRMSEIPLPHAISLRGESYFTCQEYSLAIKDGLTAIKMDPNKSKIYDWLIPAFYAIKNFHGAATLIYECLQSDVLSRGTRKKLEMLLEDAESKQEAIIRSLLGGDDDNIFPKSKKKRRKKKRKASNGQSETHKQENAPKTNLQKANSGNRNSNTKNNNTKSPTQNTQPTKSNTKQNPQNKITQNVASKNTPKPQPVASPKPKITLQKAKNRNQKTEMEIKPDDSSNTEDTEVEMDTKLKSEDISSESMEISEHTSSTKLTENNVNIQNKYTDNVNISETTDDEENSENQPQITPILNTPNKKQSFPNTENIKQNTNTEKPPTLNRTNIDNTKSPIANKNSQQMLNTTVPIDNRTQKSNTDLTTKKTNIQPTNITQNQLSNPSKTSKTETPSSIIKTENIIEDPNLVRQVGKLRWCITNIIGRGSGGTIVYKGTFDGAQCAIKTLIKAYWPKYDTEIKSLLYICMEKDDLPSTVVRYYGKEEDNERLYLALELGDQTLQHFLASVDSSGFTYPAKQNAMRDISNAVAFLHKYNIVHNDINPRNILLCKGRFKLADLGLSKWLNDDQSSYTFSNEAGPTGAGGWYAKEILIGDRKTKKVDIFSLGCVFYYILSNGVHPFGDKFYSYVNIREGKPPVLENLNPVQKQIISKMLNHNPDKRPDIQNVLEHPLFWETKKIFDFLHNVSNLMDHEDKVCKGKFDTLIKKGCPENWKNNLDEIIWNHLSQHRPYVETNYLHLIRAIRNLREHWKDIQKYYPQIFEYLGKKVFGIWSYFDSKFPELLINVWTAVNKLDLISKLEEE